MITAKEAWKLMMFCDSARHSNFNVAQIIDTAYRGRNYCDVLLGTSLTEDQLKDEIKKYTDNGYHIIRQTIYRDRTFDNKLGTDTNIGKHIESDDPVQYWITIRW